jgi:hypothetical protein
VTRAILCGDGQLDLFRSLEGAVSYVEPYEAATGFYEIFTEDDRHFLLSVETQTDNSKIAKWAGVSKFPVTSISLNNDGIDVRKLALSMVIEFVNRLHLDRTIHVNENDVFDILEREFGFVV